MRSWQIFAAAKKVLPPGELQRIYTRSSRSVYYWAANPSHAENQENPIDRMVKLLTALDLYGYGHVARAAIDIMAAPLDGAFEPLPQLADGTGTVEGEAADALVALGRCVAACRDAAQDGRIDGDELKDLIERMREVRGELDELYAVLETMALKGNGKRNGRKRADEQ